MDGMINGADLAAFTAALAVTAGWAPFCVESLCDGASSVAARSFLTTCSSKYPCSSQSAIKSITFPRCFGEFAKADALLTRDGSSGASFSAKVASRSRALTW